MPTLVHSVMIGFLFLSLIARAQDKPPVKDKDFNVPDSYIVEVHVVDKATGEEMPGITLSVRINGQPRAYSTDKNGRANIEYPADLKSLTISAKPPALVAVTYSWNAASKKDKIPDTIKFEMEPGTRIGGTVTDEAGKPIANADVEILFQNKNDPRARTMNYYETVNARTNDQGKWSDDTIPADAAHLMIRINHPDYLTGPGYDVDSTSIGKFRDASAVAVLKKGVPLIGRILDTDGNPVRGATISQGDRGRSDRPQARSDGKGQFRFAQARPGDRILLTVTATGYAPEVKSVEIKEDAETEIRLEPGHTLTGQVVDVKGNPIAKVWIAPEQWRGNRMLPIFRARIETDAQGRFVWNEAPADEVKFSILKQGYMSTRDLPLTASDKEQKLTLRPVLHISGTVVDAETKKPITEFLAIEGMDFGNRGGQIYWQDRQGFAGSADGTFEFNITESRAGHAVKIEAKNYLPAESRIFKDDETAVSLEFALKKGQPIVGTIRTSDGKPLAGAQIAICTIQSGIYIRNGEFAPGGMPAPIVKSDAAGHYELPAQIGRFSVVVLHAGGYAQIPGDQLAKSADITVQPWGRIQGTLRIGALPAAGHQIAVDPISGQSRTEDAPRITHDLSTTTDKDGHFTVERVPAGNASVSHAIQMGEGKFGGMHTAFSHAQKIEVKPGRTTEVTIGGTGRPVIGRLSVPEELTGKFAFADSDASIRNKISYPRIALPENFDQMDQPARETFFAEHAKTPQYQAYTKALETNQYFPIKIQADGSFRCDDVPAGDLTFAIQLAEPAGNFSVQGRLLASATSNFTIPPMPNGRSDEPLDIGAIACKPLQRLKTGDTAPDFSLKTLDDKPIKLSDFKGKYVIVHFWSAINRPAPDDIPVIKALWQAWGKDPRVVIISISNDQRIEWPRRFVAKNDIRWPQAFEGDSQEGRPSQKWNADRISTLFIITPDGKVLARDVHPEALESSLKKALGKPQ